MNNKENYNVSKYFDIQNCYKDDYFSLILDNKKEGEPSPFKYGDAPANINISSNNKTMPQKLIIDYEHKAKNFIPFDKNFKICLKLEKTHFTKRDIIYYKNKEIKMTNSVVYYLNNFYKKEHYIRFKTKISNTRPKTVRIINFNL